MANCRYCGTDCQEQGEHDRFFDCALYTDRKPTNADRIRSLSDEALADQLVRYEGTDIEPTRFGGHHHHFYGPDGVERENRNDAVLAWLVWLRQPAEEADHA